MISWGGTAYRLHPLFVLLMLASVFTGYFVEMVTLFGVVTIHELGHVAAAKGFGWRVRRVELLPFGGVAAVDESTNVPAFQEFAVALCGPLQNAWMAGMAALMLTAGLGDAEYWQYFLQANVMIGLFNLLPVLPLDGGKMLTAALSYRISYHKTLVYALYVSLLLSIMMVILALLRYSAGGIQINLLVIGLFLFYTNWYGVKHLPYQFLRFLVNRERRSDRMVRSGRPPSPLMVPRDAAPLAVLHRFKREEYHLLYIIGPTGDVLQVLPETRLLRAYLSRIGPPGGWQGRKRGARTGASKIG